MSRNNPWSNAAPLLLSILRIVAAFLFVQHGAHKLFGVPGGAFHLISPTQWPTLVPGLAGVIEFVGGLLLLFGLFSRPVALVLCGEMAFAYFIAHFPRSHVFPLLNGGGLAVLFCFVFLYLAAAGPGPVSLDRALRRV